MQRLLLGWDAPPLHLLRGHLHQLAAPDGEWDLSDHLIVLPTARAATRLIDLLFEAAQADGLHLRLPETVTLGELPEKLYEPKRPFAGEKAQALAWVRALESLPLPDLQRLVPQPPPAGQLEAWIELGETLKRLHRELSSQRFNFQDVLDRLTDCEEIERWQILVKLQRRYLDELDAVELWDRQTARSVALDKQEIHLEQQLLMAFCVDLNEIQRALLSAVGDRATIVIAAPPHLTDVFDEYGGLKHQEWRTRDLDVHDKQLCLAGGPAEQAGAAAEWLAELGEVSCDQIALGVADAELIAPLQQRLGRLGIDVRWAIGHPIERSAPALMFEILADCLDRSGFSDFARLARHPHLHAIVGTHAPDGRSWLHHLDEFYSNHLPVQLSSSTLLNLIDCQIRAKRSAAAADDSEADNTFTLSDDSAPAKKSSKRGAARTSSPASIKPNRKGNSLNAVTEPQYAAALYTSRGQLIYPDIDRASNYLVSLLLWCERVNQWLAPLLKPARPLAQWRRPILQVIAQLYSKEQVTSDIEADAPASSLTELAAACDILADAIERITDVPHQLDRPVSAAYVLRAALDAVRGTGLYQPTKDNSIDAIGWLEVPLDDRPNLLLMGLADSIVPQTIGADPFLPSGIRKQLSLEDNDRRHGRDAYALQLTMHSGRHTRIIVGRLAADGRPLAPSRLLLARPTPEVPPRVLRLFADHGDDFLRRDVLAHPRVLATPAPSVHLQVPAPIPGRTVDYMSVTSFGDYLRCPYRYYLRHVLKLRPLSDLAAELDPRQVGNLLHEVLEAFGKNTDVRNCIDAKQIEGFFMHQLDQSVLATYGPQRNATVEFQIEQARRRLIMAAIKQAERAQSGWQIQHVELAVESGDCFVPNTTMPLIGRIDRVDYHPEQNRWAILDYKTGAKGKKPKEAHFASGKWISLQLPLYRHMVPGIDIQRTDVGYFLLPPLARDTGIHLGEFTSEDLLAADQEAERIAKAVQQCLFWPPTTDYDGTDDFAMICQTRAQVRNLAENVALSLPTETSNVAG